MINNKRFITEYRNYIVNDIKKSDMHEKLKVTFTILADKYVAACHAGLISINECMYKLVTLTGTGTGEYDND